MNYLMKSVSIKPMTAEEYQKNTGIEFTDNSKIKYTGNGYLVSISDKLVTWIPEELYDDMFSEITDELQYFYNEIYNNYKNFRIHFISLIFKIGKAIDKIKSLFKNRNSGDSKND